MELIREHGTLTQGAIEELGGPSSNHASRRARKLATHRLLYQIHRGLYGITEDGEAYLGASTLEPVDEAE